MRDSPPSAAEIGGGTVKNEKQRKGRVRMMMILDIGEFLKDSLCMIYGFCSTGNLKSGLLVMALRI